MFLMKVDSFSQVKAYKYLWSRVKVFLLFVETLLVAAFKREWNVNIYISLISLQSNCVLTASLCTNDKCWGSMRAILWPIADRSWPTPLVCESLCLLGIGLSSFSTMSMRGPWDGMLAAADVWRGTGLDCVWLQGGAPALVQSSLSTCYLFFFPQGCLSQYCSQNLHYTTDMFCQGTLYKKVYIKSYSKFIKFKVH